jgi:hypothetical protein
MKMLTKKRLVELVSKGELSPNEGRYILFILPDMIDALRFYAKQSNWHSTSKGFALQYDPEPPITQKDMGLRARQSLKKAGVKF